MSLLLLLNNGSSGGSVATPTGTAGSNYRTTGHTTNTVAVTFATDTDYIAIPVQWTHFASPAAISSVTIDGVSAVAVAGTDTGGLNAGVWVRMQGWELVNPAGAGVTLGSSVNVVVTFAATVTVSQAVARGYKGVNQTTPSEGGFNSGIVSAGSGVKTCAPTTTTTANDYLIGSYINFGSSTADVDTVDTQIAENWDSNNGTITNAAESAVSGSGETLGWTDLTFYNWVANVWVIKAAASSGSTGTVSVTTANDTSTASGTTTVVGSLALTTENDVSTASGSTTVVGSLSLTTADDVSTASGSVGGSVDGTVSVTTQDDTSSASGTTTVIGNVSVTTNNDTSNANGSTTVVGSSNVTTSDDVSTASGNAGAVTGTVNVTTGNDTSTANGNTPASQTQDIGGGISKKSRLFVIEVDGTEYRVPQNKLESFLESIPKKIEEKKVQRNKTERFKPVEFEIVSAPVQFIEKLQTEPIYASLKANKLFLQAAFRYQQELDDEEAILILM